MIHELNWDLIRRLKADDRYYTIDQWLQTEGADRFALMALPVHRHNDEPRQRPGLRYSSMTMWRTILVMNLNSWGQKLAAKRIADSLSLRCFVRCLALDELTPRQQDISFCETHYGPRIRDALHMCARLWSSSKDRTATASESDTGTRVMDRWAVQFMAAAIPPRATRVPSRPGRPSREPS